MILFVGGLSALRAIPYVDWPIVAVCVPVAVVGLFFILWGAKDIKYGESQAEGWNPQTILPSQPNQTVPPPAYSKE